MSIETQLPYHIEFALFKRKIQNGDMDAVTHTIENMQANHPHVAMTWVFSAEIARTDQEKVDLYRRAAEYCKHAGELQFITTRLKQSLIAVERERADDPPDESSRAIAIREESPSNDQPPPESPPPPAFDQDRYRRSQEKLQREIWTKKKGGFFSRSWGSNARLAAPLIIIGFGSAILPLVGRQFILFMPLEILAHSLGIPSIFFSGLLILWGGWLASR